jgi:hypothetical protein
MKNGMDGSACEFRYPSPVAPKTPCSPLPIPIQTRAHKKRSNRDLEHFNSRITITITPQTPFSFPFPQPPTSHLLRRLNLLLRGANMRIMHLRRKLETRNRFLEMRLQRADHDEHERLGVAAERVLEEVG